MAERKRQHFGRPAIAAVEVIATLGTVGTEQGSGDHIAVGLREEPIRLLVRGHAEDTAKPRGAEGPV